MQDTDILQYTEFQRQANQPLLNVYYLQVHDIVGSPTYEQLGDSLVNDYWTLRRRALTSNLLTFERYEIRNLTNGIDFFEKDVNDPGTATGDAMPPYATVTIKLVRSTLITRNGYKRYAGIPEGAQNNGTLTGGALTNWTGVADEIADEETYTFMGDEVRVVPIIVGTDPFTGGKDLTKINPVASALPNARLGTQNTRKIKQF